MPRGRTRLTTPPGEEPAPAAGTGIDDERYLPAFQVPEEPHHPSRFRWSYVALAVLLVIAASVYAVLRLTSASRTFDPSLQVPGQQQPAPEATPGG